MKYVVAILFLIVSNLSLGQEETFVIKKDFVVYDTSFNDYRIEVVFSDTVYQAKKEYQNSFRVNLYYRKKNILDSDLSYNYFCECDWQENVPSNRKVVYRKSINNENKLVWGSSRRSVVIIEDIKQLENIVLEKYIFFPVNITE